MKLFHYKKIAFAFMLLLFSIGLHAQSKKITLEYKSEKLSTVLESVEKQVGKSFFYEDGLVKLNDIVSISVKKVDIANVVDILFNKQLSCSETNQHIVLQKVKKAEDDVASNSITADNGTRSSGSTSATNSTSNARKIRGVVRDEAGLPLPGTVIIVKDTKHIVTTNSNGVFEFNDLPVNAVLVVSFLGYKTIEYPFNGGTSIEIAMALENTMLNEAVATGYSTKKMGEITGSVQKITSSDLANSVSSPDLASLLKGKTTGLYVTERADGVQSQSSMVIRGQSTIPGSVGPTAPLVVLDGVIMGNVDLMSLVNSNDIESITLLKDAASTAIYGSRAALGVIVITTHSGKGAEGISLNVSMRTGVIRQQNLPKYLNTSQWVAQTDRYLSTIYGESPAYQSLYASSSDFVKDMRMLSDEETKQYYDWNKAIYGNTGNFSDLNLSFRAGTQKVSLYGGTGWYRESGVRLGDKKNRVNFKLNTDLKIAPWISAGFHTSVVVDNSSRQNSIPLDGSAYLPFVLPKDSNENWNKTLAYRAYGSGIEPGFLKYAPVPNALYEKEAFDNTADRNKVNGVGTFNLRLTPIEGLVLQTTNSIIYATSYINSNYDSDSQSGKYGEISSEFYWAPTMLGYGNEMHGSLSIANSQMTTFLTSNTGQYTKSFGRHKFSALVGQEYSKTAAKSAQTDYYDMLAGERNPAAAKYFGNYNSVILGVAYTPIGGQEESALFSVFGQLDYSYDQRYTVTASVRTDASPSFGKNKRYGTFYSLSGAWQLHRERFMQELKFLDNLKLRYAYGTSGRDLGGVFLNKTFYSNASSYNGQVNSGSVISQLANPNISWETTYNNTLGLDFGLLKRISGSVDLYHKLSSGLIQEFVLPATEGGFKQKQNVGEVVNKGIEVLLSADIIKTSDFTWNLSANYSFNHNEITKLVGDSLAISARYYKYVGDDINVVKGIRYAGVDPTDGAPLFENFDTQGNKVLVKGYQGASNLRNYQVIGTTTPKYFGGVQSLWTYKNLSLSTDWYFQVGNVVNNQALLSAVEPAYTAMMLGGNIIDVPSSMKIWSGPGDMEANIPNVYSSKYDVVDVNGDPGWDFSYGGAYLSSAPYQNGSHIRLRNVKLSYNLPVLFVKKCYMQSAVVYFSVDNLFVITKKGFWGKDPDSPVSVINPLRMTVGLNINF